MLAGPIFAAALGAAALLGGCIPPTTVAPPTSSSCTGVSVSPGANVQSVLNSYSSATTFCFQSGTYVLTGFITPQSGDRLISATRRGAIFTGNGTYNGGITSGGSASGVLVRGLVLKDFQNSFSSFPRAAISAGTNWTVEDNEIAGNAQIGVELKSDVVLRNNSIHHNGRYGFVGGPVSNVLIEGNDVGSNNTGHYDVNDAGGSKIHQSSNVTFRSNNVHDNWGSGLHTDWENTGIVYESNTLSNNTGPGILHEASADTIIRNNIFVTNAKNSLGKSLWWAAEIHLNDSKNTEIYGNTMRAGTNGISLVDIARGSNKFGLLEIRNVNIHDNSIMLPTGGTIGLVGDRSTAYASTSGNRFVHNTYSVTSQTAATWVWGTSKTWSQWRTGGNDTTGILNTWAP
jgi:parallel beta-helix repeat protein